MRAQRLGIILAGAAAATLAGCGGSTVNITTTPPTSAGVSGNTATVEQDLATCIVQAAWGANAPTAYQQTPGSCTPGALAGAQYTPATVVCAYNSGNSYICKATAPSADAPLAGQINGTYSVVYDGQHISWQQTP